MQKQGAKEDGSNEFSQLMLILRNLQQRQLMHQQQLQQQQHQLAQQNAQQNAQHAQQKIPNAPRTPNQSKKIIILRLRYD